MLKDWLKLICLKPVAVARKRELIRRFTTPSALFNASEQALRQAGCNEASEIAAILEPPTKAGIATGERDLETLQSLHCRYIGFNDPNFPTLLNEIPNPPLGLFVRGRGELLQNPQIAIVGSRSPSPSGKRTAFSFAAELAGMGLTITSGLASGIDSHAHQGCLSGNGHTIAVIGTGIDRIYPQSSRDLYHEVAEKGVIVTEFPPGAPPLPRNFPLRNRIISGLSLGTLVVEAGIRSGSLITARLAAEQGREVFAIPGSIHIVTSRGCHFLIRQGAKLVESITDITEELKHFDNLPPMVKNPTGTPAKATGDQSPHKNPQGNQHENQRENPLYNLIDYSPVSMERIIEQSGLTAERVSSILVDLELQGLIVETNGSYQRLPKR